jgi:hypothetical protein
LILLDNASETAKVVLGLQDDPRLPGLIM